MTQQLPATDSVVQFPIRSLEKAGDSMEVAWSDWLGMLASIGCAIHCAAMPFVIAYLPALGLNFLADESFHQWMAVGCFAIALAAFIPGIRKHGRWAPVMVGSVGLSLISIAAFVFVGDCCAACAPNSDLSAATTEGVCTDACCANVSANTSPIDDSSSLALTSQPKPTGFARLAPWLTPFGGIVLVIAHLLNHRYGCSCDCCTTTASHESAKETT